MKLIGTLEVFEKVTSLINNPKMINSSFEDHFIYKSEENVLGRIGR